MFSLKLKIVFTDLLLGLTGLAFAILYSFDLLISVLCIIDLLFLIFLAWFVFKERKSRIILHYKKIKELDEQIKKKK